MTLGMYNRCTWLQADIVLVFYGIPDIQGLSIIDLNATQLHGTRKIAHTPLPIFGSK